MTSRLKVVKKMLYKVIIKYVSIVCLSNRKKSKRWRKKYCGNICQRRESVFCILNKINGEEEKS